MKICERVINFIQIIDYKGTVRICGWIKNNEIGCLAESSMYEIWHGEKAEAIRKKLSLYDYSDCVIDACPYCATDKHEEHFIEIDELPDYPPSIYLAYEEVCNYQCTSCTTPETMSCNLGKKEVEKGYEIIEKELKKVLPYVKHLGANGRGELFASRHILKLLSEWKPIANAEDCSVSLETNGSLFDEEHWKQIENLGKYNLRVSITVMSFDEKTYQYLSGVNYPISKIENNLRFVKALREKGIINHLELATVYQERNFRFLPEFIRRCIEEFGADEVRLRPYMPWGSREPEVEWFFDIRNPKHPYYSEFYEIMQHPIFKNPKVRDWGGGRNSVVSAISPWEKAKVKEILIRKAFDEKIFNRIPKSYINKIVLYGLSDAAKGIMSTMFRLNIKPLYIIDKYCDSKEYYGLCINKLDNLSDVNLDVVVIVTVWRGFELIKDELTTIGYNPNAIFNLEVM